MAGIVTCDRIGQALVRWLQEATDQQLDLLCSVLNCDTSVQSGSLSADGETLTLLVGRDSDAPADMQEVVIDVTQARVVSHDGSLAGDGTVGNPLRAIDRVIRPEQFGADPTGTVDAASQLNLALAAAAGRELKLLPGGIYRAATPLQVYSDTKIDASSARVIRNGATDNLIRNASDGTVGGYNASSRITIRGGTWDGNNAAFPGNTTVIAFGHANTIKVHDATVINDSGWHHIEFNGVSNGEVRGCYFTGGRGQALTTNEAVQIDMNIDGTQFPWFGPIDSTPCTDIKILHNTFFDVGTAIGSHSGVPAIRHSSILIEGNSISGCYFAGVTALNWADARITKNRFDRGYHGIRAISVGAGSNNRQLIIEGNSFFNSGNSPAVGTDGRGVLVQATNDGLFNYSMIVIANNTFVDINATASQNAIGVSYCSGVQITGNSIRNVKSSGISLFGCALSNISGNTVSVTNTAAAGGQAGINVAGTGSADVAVVGNTADTIRVVETARALVTGNNVQTGPISQASNTASSVINNLIAGAFA